MRQLKGIRFWWPRCHNFDHQAIVATIQAGKWGKRRLKAYWRKQQKISLQLPPQELRDDMTAAFVALQATCKDPEAAKRHWRNWVSDKMRLLIKWRTSLRWAGWLRWCIGQHMQCAIDALLKVDRTAHMVQVGKSINANLTKGNVHEAFCHLKGWYWLAMETQARPCFQTMEKQTAERVDLYQQHDSPGLPVAVNVTPVDVWDNVSTNGEIRAAVTELTNGRSAGASCMRAEHLKEWLRGMKSEEDPETGPNNVGALGQMESPSLARPSHLRQRQDTPPTWVGCHCPHPQRRQGLSGHWPPQANMEGH
jgi:hypothetical protein